MRQVYDFADDADVLEAAKAVAAIRKTEGWNVLRQRAEVLRAEAAAQALAKNVDTDELRGRIEGVFKLLEDADALIAQGNEIARKAVGRARERGSIFAAGSGTP